MLFTKSSLALLSKATIETVFNSLNCVRIGKVNKFNTTNLTAEILIQDKWEKPDGSIEDYPLLVDVPCLCFSANNGGIDVPISENDTGILLFCDRNIDKWWSTNTVQKPYVFRCHSFNDAVFIVGVKSLKNLITGYVANATRVRYNNNSMVMTDSLTTFNNPIKSAYKSSDGSTGLTTTQTIEIGGNVVKTMTIKDGLITNIS